jgi:hypothetical protein
MHLLPRTALSTIALAALAAPSIAQTPPGPVVHYEMEVATTSGAGGGMAGAMRMMAGGGGGDADHSVALRLTTARQAQGAPRADHFFLPAVRLGRSVPLTGSGRPGPEEASASLLGDEQPRGRILMFWGCGAKAGPGQPYVLDAAKLMPAQLPAALGGASTAPRATTASARTNISWPALKKPSSGSSLLGAHRIVSNVGPEIAFTLTQDYLAALSARTATMPDGSVSLRWNAVPGATGYAATAVGGIDKMERGGDLVIWTSTGTRDGGNDARGWLSPAVVAGMIARKTVMPPTQTSCQMPAEFKRAAGEMMLTSLNAFGPELEFAYPPKPPGNAPWHPEWTAKVKFRAETSLMSGMTMGEIADDGEQRQSEPACKPRKKGGLGGMLGGALGGLAGRGRDGC